jgi:hypothetical protein
MVFSLLLLTVTSQYNRSRVALNDSASQCLWWPEKTQIVFHQNAQGNADTPGETEFLAVAAAISTWSSASNSCASLSVAEGNRTSSRFVGYDEKKPNENTVVFRQRKCTELVATTDPCWKDENCGNTYDCWQHVAGAIALTTTSYNTETGRVLDSDIELNATSFFFSTVESPPCIAGAPSVQCVAADVQNTMTHELGHSLGLSHVNVPGSTMAPSAPTGELSKRLLDADSKRFLCDVYPKGLPSRTCLLKKAPLEVGKSLGCQASPVTLAVLCGLWRRKRKV